MMDRRVNLQLVAARVTNERTAAVLELRDEAGCPRWMDGPHPGRLVRRGKANMTPLGPPLRTLALGRRQGERRAVTPEE